MSPLKLTYHSINLTVLVIAYYLTKHLIGYEILPLTILGAAWLIIQTAKRAAPASSYGLIAILASLLAALTIQFALDQSPLNWWVIIVLTTYSAVCHTLTHYLADFIARKLDQTTHATWFNTSLSLAWYGSFLWVLDQPIAALASPMTQIAVIVFGPPILGLIFLVVGSAITRPITFLLYRFSPLAYLYHRDRWLINTPISCLGIAFLVALWLNWFFPQLGRPAWPTAMYLTTYCYLIPFIVINLVVKAKA